MNATIHPFPTPMPTSSAGKILWAKTAMVESARIWADQIKLRSNASAEDLQAAHDECADILDAFLSMAKRFTDALDGDHKVLTAYFTDGIGDGLEFPLRQAMEDLDYEDQNAGHRIGTFEALGRR